VSLVSDLRLLAGYHMGTDLVERLAHAEQCQQKQRDALVAAADELEKGHAQWRLLSEEEPQDQRVLVVRDIPGAARYVDVMVWVAEPDSGLPPLSSKQHVTHWMPLPPLPADDK